MKKFGLALLIAAPLAVFALVATGAAYHLLLAAGLPRMAAAIVRDPMLRGQALYQAGQWAEAAEAFTAAGPRARYNLGNALAHADRLKDALHAFDVELDRDPEDDDAAFNRALVARVLGEEKAAEQEKGIKGGANSAAVDKRHGLGGPDEGGVAQRSTGSGYAGGQEAKSQSSTAGGSKVSKRAQGDKASDQTGNGQAYGSAADSEGVGHRGGGNANVADQEAQQRRRIDKSWETQSVQPTRQWLETVPDDEGRYLKLRLAAEQSKRKENEVKLDGGDE